MQDEIASVVLTNRFLTGVSDGIGKKEHHPEAGGRLKGRTMTGHNHLMSNSYVTAYQAEVRDGMRSAQVDDNWMRPRYLRAAAWLVHMRGRIATMLRSSQTSGEVRSFDRSSATGSCEIENGLTA